MRKLFLALLGVLVSASIVIAAAVSTEEKYLLDNKMGAVAKKVQLGTQLAAAKPVVVGNFTTAGGDANESITATGVVSTDVCFVVLKTAGATPRTVTTAACGTNAIAVVLSGDPSTDHVLSYVAYRP